MQSGSTVVLPDLPHQTLSVCVCVCLSKNNVPLLVVLGVTSCRTHALEQSRELRQQLVPGPALAG